MENSFGSLANHWRLYHRPIYLNPNNAITFIKATQVLPNILTLPNDSILNEVVEDHVQVFDGAFEDLTKQGYRPAIAAAQVCTYFTEYFCSVHGAVDWQNESALSLSLDALSVKGMSNHGFPHTSVFCSS